MIGLVGVDRGQVGAVGDRCRDAMTFTLTQYNRVIDQTWPPREADDKMSLV